MSEFDGMWSPSYDDESLHSFSWFLKTPIDNVQELEVVVTIKDNTQNMVKTPNNVYMKFDRLPSTITLGMRYGNSSIDGDECDDDQYLNISTDGHISTIITYNALSLDIPGYGHPAFLGSFGGFNHVPIGKRYGAFHLSKSNILMYQREFWRYPNAIELANSSSWPRMIKVSQRELRTTSVLIGM